MAGCPAWKEWSRGRGCVLSRQSWPSLSNLLLDLSTDRRRIDPQHLLVKFADRRLGHLVDESHLIGQPPFRHFVLQEFDHLSLGDIAFELWFWHGKDHRSLVPFGMRKTDDRRFKDLRVGHDCVLQLDGRYPLAA